MFEGRKEKRKHGKESKQKYISETGNNALRKHTFCLYAPLALCRLAAAVGGLTSTREADLSNSKIGLDVCYPSSDNLLSYSVPPDEY
jgi:hypothetical protein